MLESATRSVTKLGENIDEWVPITLEHWSALCQSLSVESRRRMRPNYKTSMPSWSRVSKKLETARTVSWLILVGLLMLHRIEMFHISFLVLPDDLLKEAIPGNIRKAEHFVAFLKRFVEYLKVGLLHPRCNADTETVARPGCGFSTSLQKPRCRFCSI